MDAQNHIPLHCIICSRGFSDVSHLLTHIQSKGHLASFFRVECQVKTDPTANPAVTDLYNAHNAWYRFYNIDNLVVDRIIEKDKKKKAAKAAKCAMTISTGSSRSTPSTIDPMLGPTIKTEPNSRSTTPLLPVTIDGRLYAPPMQSFPSTPRARSQMSRETSALTSLYTNTSSDPTEETESPTAARRRPKQTNENDTQEALDQEDDANLAEVLTKEAKKLKGTIWPGMAIFDAASPEMKRRRNQKKDTSVLKNLKKASEVIKKKELVFDGEGELRRQREITGNPDIEDEEGPLKGESSPEPDSKSKRGTTRRARKAMTKKNVNTGRTTRGRKGGQTARPVPANNKRKSTPYYAGQVSNDDLTYGQLRTSNNDHNNISVHHGHGLNIYRDALGPTPQITFNNPPPLNMLAQGFRNNPLQFPNHNMGTFGQLHQNVFGFPAQQTLPLHPFQFQQQQQQQEQPFDFMNPILFDDEATVSPPSER